MSKIMAAMMNQPAMAKNQSFLSAGSDGMILLAMAMDTKPQMPLPKVSKVGTTAILRMAAQLTRCEAFLSLVYGDAYDSLMSLAPKPRTCHASNAGKT